MEKDRYAKSILKQLGLSKNLFIQANLITPKYLKFINNFLDYSLSSKPIDRSVSEFLDSTNVENGEIYYYNDSFLFNHSKMSLIIIILILKYLQLILII